MRKSDIRFHPSPQAPALELVLRLEDGSPWRLSFSAGMERFIGHYPLVEGLQPDRSLLCFRAPDSA